MRIRQMLSLLIAVTCLTVSAPPANAQVQRVWLTHKTNDPSSIVVNWETTEPGDSSVTFGVGPIAISGKVVKVDENVTLHHVEIPLDRHDTVYHYVVSTGQQHSTDATFKAYPTDTLRVAVVADWGGKPKLDGLIKDDVHLLLTAGDNIVGLHGRCGAGVKDCTKPYADLIDAYPELFRSTPFMPAVGNHDKEIRPRGPKPPADPVYDLDATAYLKYFPLPDDGWKWHFDLPDFDLRFIALDLQHISDMGTTWQTCHPFNRGSPQFDWYQKLMFSPRPGFVITLDNERNATMRSQEGSAWHRMFIQGTAVITGFGYFAERAVVDGFPYINTSVSGKGPKYKDPKSTFLANENNYVLMTITRSPKKMVMEIKDLDGKVLDRTEYGSREAK